LAKVTPLPIVLAVNPPPFFVIGFQRSGTTLLRVMLDSHPEVAIPLDVTGLWSRISQKHGDRLDSPAESRRLIESLLAEERIKLWQVPLSAEDIEGHRVLPGFPGIMDAFYRAYAAHRGKRRWGDKDPGNILRIHEIDRWFPTARFVHIIRDGRGACLSHLGQEFGFDDVLHCAEAWREQVWWVRRIGQILGPTRYHELQYEGLLASPEAELRRLCGFLDLDYSPAMLEYPSQLDRSIPAEKRHIWPLIGEPPRKENAEKWRQEMSEGLQRCFEKRAGELLEELGYRTSPRPWTGAYRTEIAHFLSTAFRAVRARMRFRREPGSLT
jgi:hypothetical protein